MSTISVNNINDGDAVTASSVNSQINTIVNDYNGNIDSTNLAPGSVGTSEVLDDNITDAKLVYGKVRSRQGGSATNWSAAGTTTYDYSGTNTFMQVGTIANDASPKAITFPTAFNQIPVVFVQVITGVGVSCYAIASSITATNFACQVVTDTGAANTAQTINWFAIGQ